MATPMMTAEPSERSVSMRATVRPAPIRFHPHISRSRKVRVAYDLNISPAMADKLLYGAHALNLRYAAVIESDLRVGDHDAVAQWIAPADAALMGTDVPHIADALAAYDLADADEERAQAEIGRKHAADMTDAELDAYAKAVAKEAYKATRALAAIRREQDRRRA